MYYIFSFFYLWNVTTWWPTPMTNWLMKQFLSLGITMEDLADVHYF